MKDLLILTLTSHVLDSTPISKSIWRKIRSEVASEPSVESLLSWSAKNLNPADQALVQGRLDEIEKAEEIKDSLASDGVTLITEFEDAYPAAWKNKLRDGHPPLLFVAGNAGLLSKPLVGIVGSRDVDESGSEFAASVAEEAVNLGYGVISGGARGVDQISMRATHNCEGESVGILADSLHKTATQSATAAALESGRVCLATPFSPFAGFQVGNAMGRNKLIYAASVGTVVVSAAEGSGGTWAGAVEALEGSLCTVIVRTGADVPDGNLKLVSKGGTAIERPSELKSVLTLNSVPQPTLL